MPKVAALLLICGWICARGVSLSSPHQLSGAAQVEPAFDDVETEVELLEEGRYACEKAGVHLTRDEVKFARCPPGRYATNQNWTASMERAARIRKALCVTKARGGWSHNPREDSSHEERGYMTYESRLWPKKEKCLELPAEQRGEFVEVTKHQHVYRSDTVAGTGVHNVARLIHKRGHLEFRKIWKVASSTIPKILKCQYGAEWEEVPATEPAVNHTFIFVAVREPIGRWISGMGEIMQRAINGWCITGPCEWNKETKSKVKHATTWYKAVRENGTDNIEALVQAMVEDTRCNYDHSAAPHISTQSTFVSQNTGAASRIKLVMKLEDLETGLDQVARVAADRGLEREEDCDTSPHNVGSAKPNKLSIPSAEQVKEVLDNSPELMQELCLMYAQDYICFDYELPEACKDLF